MTRNLEHPQYPLYYAILHSNFEVVKLLIESGADVNIKNSKNCTVLDSLFAISMTNEEKFELLTLILNAGFNLQIEDINKHVMLHKQFSPIHHIEKAPFINSVVAKMIAFFIGKNLEALRIDNNPLKAIYNFSATSYLWQMNPSTFQNLTQELNFYKISTLYKSNNFDEIRIFLAFALRYIYPINFKPLVLKLRLTAF